MGDRGNIVLRGGNCFPHDVFFYTHWRGSDLTEIVRNGLAKGFDRWEDHAYLARILFTELIDGDTDNTGFGISLSQCDNEHSYRVVDFNEGLVYCESESGELVGIKRTFADYVLHASKKKLKYSLPPGLLTSKV